MSPLDWVRTQENRDKPERWFRGDVLRSIDGHGRAVLIGSWLHTDGLMARLKNTEIFTVFEFPLLREGAGTDIERCMESKVFDSSQLCWTFCCAKC
ncbi:MAG TPA: hypothetical protein VMR17_19565 [Xanthobacteraceae bacterium]|nr:hypothetical protein [Xanthobacteraceae bacterium]